MLSSLFCFYGTEILLSEKISYHNLPQKTGIRNDLRERRKKSWPTLRNKIILVTVRKIISLQPKTRLYSRKNWNQVVSKSHLWNFSLRHFCRAISLINHCIFLNFRKQWQKFKTLVVFEWRRFYIRDGMS